MAFSGFRYLREARQGLDALCDAGVTWDELLQQIRSVQQHWQPEGDDDLQHVVPFRGFFLVFTVAQASRSTLVLAAVEPQPRA